MWSFPHAILLHSIYNLVGNPHSQKRAYSEEYPDVGRYIDLMQSKFPYMRYNFFSNTFHYNELRARGVDFVQKEHKLFNAALTSDEEFLRIFSEGYKKQFSHIGCGAFWYKRKSFEHEREVGRFLQSRSTVTLNLSNVFFTHLSQSRRNMKEPRITIRSLSALSYWFTLSLSTL